MKYEKENIDRIEKLLSRAQVVLIYLDYDITFMASPSYLRSAKYASTPIRPHFFPNICYILLTTSL